MLTIIIPLRNEVENLKNIKENFDKNLGDINYEVIFINDFSSDKTLEKVNEIVNVSKNYKVFNNQKKGLGGALNLGIEKSDGDYICFIMADLSDDINDLKNYYTSIKSGNLDAVFGSRFIKGGKIVEYPKLKYVLNRLGNLLAKLLLWTDLNDFTNGFKIYKKDTLLGLYPLVSEGFNIFLELPLKTIIRGYKYKIIPISYYNRTVGEAKFKIQELGSKYLFTLLYCFLEKILLNTKIK